MTTTVEPVWMTQAAFDRLERELAELTAPGREQDDAQKARTLQLRELIRRAEVSAKPDDGLVEAGMKVRVRFERDGSEETFLLGSRDLVGDEDLELDVYSPTSPLGAAISGLTVGQSTEFAAPNGTSLTVTVLEATPFG